MQGQSPSAEYLAAVCSALGINGEWLLTGRGPMRHAEIRSQALREANATELLTAMAATLERLLDRVERLEVFLQTLEVRLRASKAPDPLPTPDVKNAPSTPQSQRIK